MQHTTSLRGGGALICSGPRGEHTCWLRANGFPQAATTTSLAVDPRQQGLAFARLVWGTCAASPAGDGGGEVPMGGVLFSGKFCEN